MPRAHWQQGFLQDASCASELQNPLPLGKKWSWYYVSWNFVWSYLFWCKFIWWIWEKWFWCSLWKRNYQNITKLFVKRNFTNHGSCKRSRSSHSNSLSWSEEKPPRVQEEKRDLPETKEQKNEEKLEEKPPRVQEEKRDRPENKETRTKKSWKKNHPDCRKRKQIGQKIRNRETKKKKWKRKENRHALGLMSTKTTDQMAKKHLNQRELPW